MTGDFKIGSGDIFEISGGGKITVDGVEVKNEKTPEPQEVKKQSVEDFSFTMGLNQREFLLTSTTLYSMGDTPWQRPRGEIRNNAKGGFDRHDKNKIVFESGVEIKAFMHFVKRGFKVVVGEVPA